jgi:hypothetical protein
LNSQCEHYALLVICHKHQFSYLFCYPFCPFFTYITRPRAFVYKYIPHVTNSIHAIMAIVYLLGYSVEHDR